MIRKDFGKARAAATAVLGVPLLAACATTPPPVAYVPPPPAPVVYVPSRPLPPQGAVGSMFIPAKDAFGVRQTINANLTPAQKTWNLRSAMNVAALNCLEPQYAAILENYKVFLKSHAKGLTAANRTLDTEFRAKYGATYRVVRDGYMTQVYNYFALPPTLPRFCDASLAVSNELAATPAGSLDVFAAGALPRLEAVFNDFFGAFEQYRIEVAQWDAQYGPKYSTTSTGYSNPLGTVSTVSTAPSAIRPAMTLTLPVAAPAALVPAQTAPAAGSLVLPPATPAAASTAAPAYGPSAGRR